MTRIWEQDFRNHEAENRKRREKGEKTESFRLTLIIPVVIYHGRPKWNISEKFGALFDCAPELEFCIPDFEYVLCALSLQLLNNGQDGLKVKKEAEAEGRRIGLLMSIEIGLECGFGKDGLMLLPEIRKIHDTEMLAAIQRKLWMADSPDEVRDFIQNI